VAFDSAFEIFRAAEPARERTCIYVAGAFNHELRHWVPALMACPQRRGIKRRQYAGPRAYFSPTRQLMHHPTHTHALICLSNLTWRCESNPILHITCAMPPNVSAESETHYFLGPFPATPGNRYYLELLMPLSIFLLCSINLCIERIMKHVMIMK